VLLSHCCDTRLQQITQNILNIVFFKSTQVI